MSKISTIAIVGVFLMACSESKDIDPVPKISIEEVSSTMLKEFVDTLTITLHYEDGDGDLGFGDPDSNSLWVKDERLSNPDRYFIPLLAPENSEVSIVGNINIKLRNTFLIGSGGEELTKYTIRLKDRAGNWSNEVETPVISIRQ